MLLLNNGNVPYIFSGFLCDIGLSIGQIKVDDKSNEIKYSNVYNNYSIFNFFELYKDYNYQPLKFTT